MLGLLASQMLLRKILVGQIGKKEKRETYFIDGMVMHGSNQKPSLDALEILFRFLTLWFLQPRLIISIVYSILKNNTLNEWTNNVPGKLTRPHASEIHNCIGQSKVDDYLAKWETAIFKILLTIVKEKGKLQKFAFPILKLCKYIVLHYS